MKLLTKEIEKQLEASRLYSQEKADNPKIIVKFFTPWSNWTWYVIEGERQGDDWLFFGLVEGHETELGYFTLSELQSIQGPFGLSVERDMYFGEKTLNDVRRK